MLNRSFILALVIFSFRASGQYRETRHRDLPEGVVAVSQPGSYGEPGTTYMLTQDISSETTALFLGKDVTLDLNGFTVRYAAADYEHIPNSGFEEGEKGWDLTRAPGAEVVSTKEVHVFIGEKILQLKKGDAKIKVLKAYKIALAAKR